MSEVSWMGPVTSTVPIIVSINAATKAEVAADVQRIEAQYPVASHGTNPGPIVKSVAGPFHCSIALIPAQYGDLARWGMLKQKD